MKHLINNYRTSINPPYKRSDTRPILATIALIIGLGVGTYVLTQQTFFKSNAAGAPVLETESGTISGNVTIGNDANASGGKYIQLGQIAIGVTRQAPSVSPTTQVTQNNNCLPNPHLCGYPDATNTGVPTGTTLAPSGGLNITTAGTIVDAKDISGGVVISANNVTIKRTRIRSSDLAAVRILDGITGFIIQDSEIDGLGGTDGNFGIEGPGKALRTNIYGVENGIDPQGGPLLVQDSWIHNLLAPGAPHYDGIQNDGGSSLQIIHNTIDTGQYDQTSAIMNDNYFGPVNNVTVDNNLLAGGGYVVYVDNQFNSQPITNITIINNRFGKSQYGYGNIKVPITQSGNVNDATGQAINL